MSAADDQFDAAADETILGCLNLEKPRSFFLYAGAGSGKTRSLVEAIRRVCHEQGRRLWLTGQKIGVITYTNAACDEIKQRLEFDPRVEVSTIHAFAWSLIAGHDGDIRQWLATRLLQDVAELEQAQAKGRPGSKAATDRARSIESKLRRHAGLDAIARFVYSPTGDNRTRDSLSHSEVISMTADFLAVKPGLRRLLVTRFPILLIDESQDTNRRLMDVLLDVELAYRDAFCLGLFGDTMQRIYADGKDRLAEAIPERWARPRKRMNHRCPTRVIELINRIRHDEDREEQVPRSDASSGVVRLFVVSQGTADKTAAEAAIAARMAEITGDRNWAQGSEAIKTLALEHLMAARRFGFEAFFEPLYSVERIRTSFLQGAGAGIGLFTREILPLVTALRASDHFAAAAIVRRTSPLLERKALEEAGDKQADILSKANVACNGLLALVSADEKPSARAVLAYIAKTRLFAIPDVLVPFATADEVAIAGNAGGEADNETSREEDLDLAGELGSWREALEAPFDQIEKYDRYVRGVSQFDTHQGVKGLEFPRVMVIVSDEEARGFMFAYDKLFGAKGKSKADLENEATGKETAIDRTRRLFYVTCSRAEESLAVVYYAADPASSRDAMIRQGWFKSDEIELFGQ
ncbi:UvrD-helicase domain-containing protein [Burkholderia thailandensis]|uniref:UvrD-helicase domain-containing protein n=1 Tax=Burkholderia thailandensis TaxID=57975 RepID=UPI0003EC9A5C|nr:UvrD-helicase domain-containing protein [Burkholderia thailandensis]AHI65739.1 uvrD/REP helicase N-terminal domain protein [Burkholderia thailandensis H0587]AOJ51984.1 Fis family transcriptional regulator [Burkholderia thailandensis]AVR24331.1 ATP-dependent helicase [Burkholderia thailandensis]